METASPIVPISEMLARLYLLMPYAVSLAQGEELPPYEAKDGDYTVRFLQPMTDVNALSGLRPHSLTLDGKAAFEANVMRIDFQKNSFDRGIHSPLDPPEDVIRRAVEEFHYRLRFVTRAAHARPISCSWVDSWILDYTND